MDRIFICYSRKDKTFVDGLVYDLNMAGVNTWYDVNDIPRDKASSSQSWRRAVDRALRESTHMIVVLSPNSVASEEVESEWNYFLKQKRPLFPIIIRDCDVPYRLDALNWFDFRQDYETAFNGLIELLPYTPSQSLTPPPIDTSYQHEPIYDDTPSPIAGGWMGIPKAAWIGGAAAALGLLIFAVWFINGIVQGWPRVGDGTPTATTEGVPTQATDATQDGGVPTDQPTNTVTETPTLTPTEQPTEVVIPTPLGEGTGKIAFVSGEFMNSLDIFLMGIDGSDFQNLTNNPSNYQSLAWSPDGSKIAFVSAREGNDDIYVMNSDGSSPINVTNSEGSDGEPAWSPDGSQIAFRSERGGGYAIWIMGSDGSNPMNLTPEALTYDDPAWSPDGSQIAFTLLSDEGGEIYVMNADGSNAANLTNHAADDERPEWSPDGAQIAFSSDRDGDAEIYVMNADGSSIANLTNHEAIDSFPAWSPDGTRIAFVSDRDGNFEIYLINRDGTNLSQLTANVFFDSYPVWQPAPTSGFAPLLSLIFDFASYSLPSH